MDVWVTDQRLQRTILSERPQITHTTEDVNLLFPLTITNGVVYTIIVNRQYHVLTRPAVIGAIYNCDFPACGAESDAVGIWWIYHCIIIEFSRRKRRPGVL